jgi:hypothetical protein
VDVCVEPYANLAGDGARRFVSSRWSSIKPREIAKHPIERDTGEGEAHHSSDNQRHQKGGAAVLLGNCSGHQFIPVLAIVMKKKRITNAPKSHAVIFARSRWRLRMTSSSGLTM